MVRTTIPIAIILLGVGCSSPQVEQLSESPFSTTTPASALAEDSVQQQAATWRILPHEPGTLILGGKDTLKTGLHDLQLLKEIKAPSGVPWYVFRARSSDRPKGGKLSLYVFCPDDQICAKAIEEPWYMPGRLFDGPDDEDYYEAEVFAGEVLRDTIGVIWYDRSLMPDGNWRQNTVLLNLNAPQPDTLVLFGHERKSSTIDLAFRGKCVMLEGIDQHIRP